MWTFYLWDVFFGTCHYIINMPAIFNLYACHNVPESRGSSEANRSLNIPFESQSFEKLLNFEHVVVV